MQGPQQLPGSGHLRATWLPACASKQLSARVHLPRVGTASDMARLPALAVLRMFLSSRSLYFCMGPF